MSQASPQLKAVWTPYDVTIIPGRHLLDSMPAPPKVTNLTNGGLSDTNAEAMAWAEYRENAVIGWLEVNVQPGLNDHIRAHGLFNGVVGNAVRGGQSVTDPPCDLYASEIAVVPVTDAIKQFELGKGYSVTSPYALVEKYGSPSGCTTTAGMTHPTVLYTYQSFVGVETGSVRDDSAFGAIYSAESGRNCAGDSTDPTVCGDVQ